MHEFPWKGEIEWILKVEWWWVGMQTGEISLEGRKKRIRGEITGIVGHWHVWCVCVNLVE